MSLHIIAIVESIADIPQFFLQFVIIYRVHTYKVTQRNECTESLNGLMIYMSMFNFCQWIIDSFVEIPYLTHRFEHTEDVIVALHGVIHLFMPFLIYGRYIGTFLMLKCKLVITKDLKLIEQNHRE